MKEFEIEFERKLQIERAQFDQKRLELETQMQELEMQHQLRQKEQDLERQLQKTALEKDDLLSQSTKARDKSPFNWTSKGRDVSEWANLMNNTRTPILQELASTSALNGISIGITHGTQTLVNAQQVLKSRIYRR